MELFSSLEECLDKSWDLLFQAANKRNDPMRTPVMGTYDGKHCQLRTIVLRASEKEKRRLLFFTDIRTPKIENIENQATLSLCFYHPRKHIQIRIQGKTALQHNNEEAKNYWERLSNRGRKSYATIKAPGSISPLSTNGLPAFWEEDMEKEKSDFAFQNFVLIEVFAFELDCLHLHPDGHQRAMFKWEDTEWKGSWTIP